MANFIQNAKENNQLINIFSGIIKSFIITFILIIILSAVLVNTNISEDIIGPAIFVITCISILVGAMSSIRKNGIVYGGIVGIAYVLTIYLLSSILGGEFGLTINSLILIILSILSGMLGGIIGVNIKNRGKEYKIDK